MPIVPFSFDRVLVANNYPAFLAIILKDGQELVVDFTSGKEYIKLNLDPAEFVGKTIEEIFGDQASIVRENYMRAFMGAEVSFELFINDQYQLYNAIPLIDENEAIDRILVVVENITERKLFETQEQEAAALEERERLARELHDSVSQILFTAGMIADATPRLWDKDPASGQQNLEMLSVMIRGASAEMRSLLLELRPDTLRDQTLGKLLETLAVATRARTRATVSLKVEGECQYQEDVTMAFHRITQEILNNIAKHAEASEVVINLSCDPEGTKLCKLCIQDDGRGFDPLAIPAGHLGIGIMRERAQKIGADIKIDSEIGRGTQVSVSWSASGDKTEHE